MAVDKDTISDETLTINTDEVKDLCSAYKSKIAAIGIESINVTSDFSAITSCGFLTSFVSSLQTVMDKIKNSISNATSALEGFSLEQEQIDSGGNTDGSSTNGNNSSGNNRSGGGGGGGGGGGNESKTEAETEASTEITEITNEQLEMLLNNEDFLNSLIAILLTNSDILDDVSKSDYLKSLLILKNVSNSEEITTLLSNVDSKVLQKKLKEAYSEGKIKINETTNESLVENKAGLTNVNENETTEKVEENTTEVIKEEEKLSDISKSSNADIESDTKPTVIEEENLTDLTNNEDADIESDTTPTVIVEEELEDIYNEEETTTPDDRLDDETITYENDELTGETEMNTEYPDSVNASLEETDDELEGLNSLDESMDLLKEEI